MMGSHKTAKFTTKSSGCVLLHNHGVYMSNLLGSYPDKVLMQALLKYRLASSLRWLCQNGTSQRKQYPYIANVIIIPTKPIPLFSPCCSLSGLFDIFEPITLLMVYILQMTHITGNAGQLEDKCHQ